MVKAIGSGVVATVAIASFLVSPARSAPIVDTPVAGSLDFAFVQHNYFDPVNGYVPEMYLNSLGCTVDISDTAVEFGFADATAEISANFTAARLVVKDHLFEQNSYKSFQLAFTNSAVTSLVMVSNTFPAGSLIGSLNGNVITVNWDGGAFDGERIFQAVFDVTLPPLPWLKIRLLSTNAVVVSWPAACVGYALQEARRLDSTNWLDVFAAPSVTNGENQVTVSPPARARFYRLKQQ